MNLFSCGAMKSCEIGPNPKSDETLHIVAYICWDCSVILGEDECAQTSIAAARINRLPLIIASEFNRRGMT